MLFQAIRQQGALAGRHVATGAPRTFTRSAITKDAAETAKQTAQSAAETAKKGAQEAAQTAKQATDAVAETAQKGGNVAEAAKKGAEGVTESAKEGAQKAQSQLSGVAAKAQELGGAGMKRLEGMFGCECSLAGFAADFVDRALITSMSVAYSEPVVYNLKVAGAIAKQVYRAERLAPPTSLEQITSSYKTLWSRASDAGYWSKLVSSGEWQKVGIYAIEALGIFTIGEMVSGRCPLRSNVQLIDLRLSILARRLEGGRSSGTGSTPAVTHLQTTEQKSSLSLQKIDTYTWQMRIRRA